VNAVLQAAVDLGGAGLFTGFIVFLRVGAAMAVLPAFGEQSVPRQVRLILALVFTAVVAPAVAEPVAPLAARGVVIGPFLATEVVIGLAIGLVLRLFVLALQVTGTIAAQATSLSQIFGNAGAEPMPALSHLMVIGGLALAVLSGLHVRLAETLILSYGALPPGQFPDAGLLRDWGLANVVLTFGLAFSLAAPFVLASAIYNVALGVINRAMPQLMVAFVGAPALTAGALALMVLAVPAALAVWISALDAYLANPFSGG
jgi:flagellar biosynthetic protein FliR